MKITERFDSIPTLQVGDIGYARREEIDGEVVRVWVVQDIPKTNRGLPCGDGWLGSYTNPSGVTYSQYADGRVVVESITRQDFIEQMGPFDEERFSTYLVTWTSQEA